MTRIVWGADLWRHVEIKKWYIAPISQNEAGISRGWFQHITHSHGLDTSCVCPLGLRKRVRVAVAVPPPLLETVTSGKPIWFNHGSIRDFTSSALPSGFVTPSVAACCSKLNRLWNMERRVFINMARHVSVNTAHRVSINMERRVSINMHYCLSI